MSDLLHRQIAALHRQLEERDETILQLREALSENTEFPSWLPHLTRNEETVLRLLWKREVVSTTTLVAALGENAVAIDPVCKLRVYIKRLREKLHPIGFKITNDWGRGYHLDQASRERLSPPRAA